MEEHEKHSPESIALIEKELRYISHLIKQKGREILSNFTITPPQFVALQWLHESGDMTIGDLSTRMYLAFSTTWSIPSFFSNLLSFSDFSIETVPTRTG